MEQIKRLLNEHPLITLLGAFVAVVGTTFSIVSYFSSERIEGLRITHSQQMHEVKQQISEMKTRLVSVERVIGRSGKETYRFDLSKVLFDYRNLPRYRSTYDWHMGDGIGIKLPESFSWEISRSNLAVLQGLEQIELLSRANRPPESETIDFGDWLNEQHESLDAFLAGQDISTSMFLGVGKLLASTDVIIWHHPELRAVHFADPEQSPVRMQLIPHIAVWKISGDFMSEIISASVPFTEVLIRELLTMMEDEITEFGDIHPAAQPVAAGMWEDLSAEIFGEGTYLIDNIELSMLYLFGILQQEMFGRSVSMDMMGYDTTVAVRSFQRRLNLTYIAMQEVYNNTSPELGETQTIFVDKEFFMIGRADDLLIIRVVVPSFGNTQEHYSAVQLWFSDVKVPVQPATF